MIIKWVGGKTKIAPWICSYIPQCGILVDAFGGSGSITNMAIEQSKAKRYVYNELPKLSFKDNSFDLVLSSHFLFLYSEHLSLQFHIDSILEMCRVSTKEVKMSTLKRRF